MPAPTLAVILLFACLALGAGPAGAQGVVSARLILAKPPAGGPAAAEIIACQERARRTEATADDFAALGWAWVSYARALRDDGAYRLVLATAEAIDERFGPGPESLLLRGMALHNLHRFSEGETVARQLVAQRGDPRDHALLGDILMERGDLAGAAAAVQDFVNRQPGLEAYARVAHLRWLRGDTPGAIAAMTEAARAGDPRSPEPLAWTTTRLGQLYLHSGDAAMALRAAERALGQQAGYPPALFLRGCALLALGQASAARPPLQAAVAAHALPEYRWWLAEALRAEGDEAGASAVEDALVADGARIDPRTTALFLATRGLDPERAVRLARDELALRGDGHTHDALAWALFRAGRPAEALENARAAVAVGTRDARLLLHAGLILAANDDAAGASDLVRGARELSASLTPGEKLLLPK